MASFIDYDKYQSTYCRMPECKWSGHFTNIEEHFTLFHPKHLRETHQKSYFNMTFEELHQKDPLLLSTYSGVYWFVQNQQQKENFSKGIFGIGTSKPVEYRIKLTKFSTEIVEILGPFQTREEKSKQYDFKMQFEYMDYSKIVIIFGEFQEEADEYDSDDPDRTQIWTPQDRFIYEKIIFCGACERHVVGDPFFCENRHLLCEECYEIVISADCPECNLVVLKSVFSLQNTNNLQKIVV